ncbi:MAG TPA: glycosyltransferase family 2 protein [Candidatus Limnocylindria bacterium]|nr:glycosyltransferase family 2 protein [Candidatus Limnocylindria bacterium]
MIERVFWAAVGLIGYTYVGFPLLVLVRGALAPRPYRSEPITPSVSLIIAAHNEEVAIASKLASLEQLEYPQDRLQVVVASDGSDDRTEDVVAAHSGRPTTLLRLPRQGKAYALNAAVDQATGDILVFTDANSRLAPDALRRLVAPFADPTVGGVAGNQVYASGEGGDRAEGERTYWSFDRLMKQAESRAGNTISATGALYAVRRSLVDPIPPDVTDDFYTSVGVITRRRRLVFAPGAIAFEAPSKSGRREFRRKVRIMTRGLAAVRARRELLDPRVHGFYSLQLASHKVLRRLMGVPMIVCAVLAPALWGRGPIYQLATVAQIMFYGCAAAGLLPWRGARLPMFGIPAFICSAVAASMAATWNTVRGRRIDRWQPTHAGNPSEE